MGNYTIAHSFDFSPTISTIISGGTTSVLGELSETPILTTEFTNRLQPHLNEAVTIESEFRNSMEGTISEVPTLTPTVFQGMILTGVANASLSADAEFTYLWDFTKNISETATMEKTRTHYVWDGGIILS